MRRVLAATGAAVAVAVLAPGVAAAATRNVFVGGDGVVRNAPKQFSPNAFLRRTITVHVGDTVRWRFRGFHTVTVPPRGNEPPAFVLATKNLVSGAVDAANQPFWFNGRVPVLAPNPRAAAPARGATYDGTKFRNSGLARGANPRPYSLRFTRAGSFDYYCAVHPGMEGRVRVVGPRQRVPSEAQNRAAATAELARLASAARRTAAAPARDAMTVDVGRAPRGQRFTIDAFFPSNPTVKAGQALTFTMVNQNRSEIHTVTFGPQTREQLPFITQTGIVNPVAAYPSDQPPSVPVYTGTNHGNGFLNSGTRDNDRATPTIGNFISVTFTKPGTYPFKCLVHEGMDGQVTVTP